MEFVDILNDLSNFVHILEICYTSLNSVECCLDGFGLFTRYV